MKNLTQEFTGKKTSINTTKLPAIYSKLNLEKLRGKTIFDFGAGKPETCQIIRNELWKYRIDYIPYDKYNLPEELNRQNLASALTADIFICSNVLNVIKEDDIIQSIIETIAYKSLRSNTQFNHKPFFFTIYDGDKSGIGKQSQDDCWQRNQKLQSYLDDFNWGFMYPVKYKSVITNNAGKEYLK